MAKSVMIRPLYVLHNDNPYFQQLPPDIQQTLWKFNARELRTPYIDTVFMPLTNTAFGEVIIRYHKTAKAIDWWFEKRRPADSSS